MKHEYIVKSSRLTLRPLNETDLEMVRQWRNKEGIRQSFINQSIIEKDQQKKWFEKYVLNTKDLMFIIEETNLINIPIGTVALYNMDIMKAEFGRLLIGPTEAQGKGYGQEVTKMLCSFGFYELGLSEIYLEVISNNEKAKKLYEKCGFEESAVRQEGELMLIRMILTQDKLGEA